MRLFDPLSAACCRLWFTHSMYLKSIRNISMMFVFMLFVAPTKGQLYINEFQASNISTSLDPEGNYREWIEIYNAGNSSIDLDGYFLSTDMENPFLREIKNLQVGANSFAIIWLDQSKDDPCCEFQLEMVGGEVGLFSPSGELLDSVRFQPQFLDISFGRSPDGSENWSYLDTPSPNAPNHLIEGDINAVSEEVVFSLEGGFYEGDQVLTLFSNSTGGEIRYTIDGSWPTPSSPIYTGPITLSENTVLRAKLFQEDRLPGPVTTKTYIMNDHSSLPVVSIVTDENHFFDHETGIYVEGTNGEAGNCMDEPVNWNRAWERPANIEYFTKDGQAVLNQLAGVKIFGGCSRTRVFKSLAVIARHKYGDNSLSYNFFHSKEVDEFKSIVLRNSGNDSYYSMLRDGFMQSLVMGDLDLDCQGYQPAVVFLNGEYWGILNVREKMNEHFPESNYNLDSDYIDVLEKEYYMLRKEVVHGFGEHYQELMDFISANSLSNSANYEYVKTQMDVNEYMNYFLTQVYIENRDWPNNNVKYWRPHVEGGKWRWLLYDTDFGWGLVPRSSNFLVRVTNQGTSSALIEALLENEDFKHEFIQRMAGLVNTTFNPDRVQAIYDSLRAQLTPEIERHIDRWYFPRPSDYANHHDHVIPAFTQEQPDIVRANVKAKFGLSGMYILSANVNDPARGYIKASGISLPDNFSGSYFNNVPVHLVAIPRSGYRFSHWEGASSSTRETVDLDFSANASIRAVFVHDHPIGNVFINEVCASNETRGADEFGQFEDWIEIYNDNDFEVNLAGWYLSDSAGMAKKFQIPADQADLTTVGAKDYLMIWCDGDLRQGPLHSNFKLKRSGEALSLVQQIDQELHYVDSLHYPELSPDLTYGRIPGSEEMEYMIPTPLAQNETGDELNLFINEWMTRNCGLQRDEFDESDDWIEIYNPNPFPVNLEGLYITDSLQDPLKHRIPSGSSTTIIPPFGYKILWADKQTDQGALHLGFKLDAKNEEIGLYKLGQGYLDKLPYSLEHSGVAMGRYPDGSDLIQMLSASPGGTNHIVSVDGLFISEISASGNHSHPDNAGEYDDWIEIYNHNDFAVDVGGLFLTDSLNHPTKYRIPCGNSDSTTIAAKDYLILWADDQTEQGVTHLGFKLSGKGEQVGLVDMDGMGIIDSLSFPDQYSNFTYNRANNTGSWCFLRPSHKAFNSNTPVSGVSINEFSASNYSMDDPGVDGSDWIELYNANDFPVDIGGLYLSDTIGEPAKYRIPSHSPELSTIPAKSFFILHADGEKELGLDHTNFKLSRKGEAVLLTDYDMLTVLDSITYPEQYKNSAYGRVLESGDWRTIPPTPGASNLLPDVSHLMINEVMGNNKTTVGDEYNEYDDWIELYNSGDKPLDVGGLYISDSLNNPSLFRISTEYPDSTTIPARGHLILWGDDSVEQGILHLCFKISKTGETIGIFDYEEELIDSTSFPFISPNLSWGRLSDGDDTWISFDSPTPNVSNVLFSGIEEKEGSEGITIYPNPVTSSATIDVVLAEACEIHLEIIDSKGMICSSISDFHDGNGKQSFQWNVDDVPGSSLKSGIYYCRVQTNKKVLTGKIVISR